MNSVGSQPQSLPPGNEQEASVPCPPNPHKQRYAIVLIVAILLIASGTVTWVLNIIGIIHGPWSSVISAIFTGTGIIVVLLDSLLALMREDGRRG